MKRITKSDMLLIALLLIIGIGSLFAVRIFMNQTEGTSVQVTVDGVLYGTYELNQTPKDSAESAAVPVIIPVIIDGIETNRFQIKDGKAKMIQANCPDQLCIHQKEISKQGETIICLPNRVVVEIHGVETAELDSVSR